MRNETIRIMDGVTERYHILKLGGDMSWEKCKVKIQLRFTRLSLGIISYLF